MSIDRIGRRATFAADASGTEGTARTRRASTLAEPTETKPAAPVQARRALGRLRARELDMDGYVEAGAEEATSDHRDLPPARRAFIEEALRERLTTDLADLVEAASR